MWLRVRLLKNAKHLQNIRLNPFMLPVGICARVVSAWHPRTGIYTCGSNLCSFVTVVLQNSFLLEVKPARIANTQPGSKLCPGVKMRGVDLNETVVPHVWPLFEPSPELCCRPLGTNRALYPTSPAFSLPTVLFLFSPSGKKSMLIVFLPSTTYPPVLNRSLCRRCNYSMFALNYCRLSTWMAG